VNHSEEIAKCLEALNNHYSYYDWLNDGGCEDYSMVKTCAEIAAEFCSDMSMIFYSQKDYESAMKLSKFLAEFRNASDFPKPKKKKQVWMWRYRYNHIRGKAWGIASDLMTETEAERRFRAENHNDLPYEKHLGPYEVEE
jgi:hypothetical protein